jgi:hypothetical protein
MRSQTPGQITDERRRDAPTDSKAAEQMKANLVNACKRGDDKTVQQIVRDNMGALTATDLGEALIVTCRFQTETHDDIAVLLMEVGAQMHSQSLKCNHLYSRSGIYIHYD